jgi:hypothetical protein
VKRSALPSLVSAAILAMSASAAPAREAIRAFPPAMIGTWGYESRSCTEESDDGRVEVKARSVTFFASDCSIGRFRSHRDGTVTGQGRCRGEGETSTERGSVRLRLEGPTSLVIAVDGGDDTRYQRCERPLPVR